MITVSDGVRTARWAAFNIEVRASPRLPTGAPTISGAPATFAQRRRRLQLPADRGRCRRRRADSSASRTRHNGRPSIRSTGRLSRHAGSPATSGRPPASASASATARRAPPLTAFAITVNAASSETGAVTLDWTPPTSNTDGSVLSNLAGYRIAYGTDPNSLGQTIEVSNPSVTSYVVQNLSGGDLVLLAALLHERPGAKSASSNPVSKQGPVSPLHAQRARFLLQTGRARGTRSTMSDSITASVVIAVCPARSASPSRWTWPGAASMSSSPSCAAPASRRASSATTSRRARWRSSAASASRGKLRDAGLPADYPNDVVVPHDDRPAIELARIPIPCRARPLHRDDGPDTWWPTPEPPHRINQIYPRADAVRARRSACRASRILNRTAVDDFAQDERRRHGDARAISTRGESCRIALRATWSAATAAARRCASRSARSSTATPWSSACSRPTSARRSCSACCPSSAGLGALLAQSAPLRQRLSRSTAARPGWSTTTSTPDETDFEAVDRDWAIRTILGVGAGLPLRGARQGGLDRPPPGRRPVPRPARLHLRRCRAHLGAVRRLRHERRHRRRGEPRLAARGAPAAAGRGAAILDAYEAERLPITEQVSHFAMDHAHRDGQAAPRACRPRSRTPAPEGERRAPRVGRGGLRPQRAAVLLRRAELRLLLRRARRSSPTTASRSRPTRWASFTPSTVPGCRTPHIWLRDGRSLYDALGPDYTLLRFDPTVDVSPLLVRPHGRGVPSRCSTSKRTSCRRLSAQARFAPGPARRVARRRLPSDVMILVDRLRGRIRQ